MGADPDEDGVEFRSTSADSATSLSDRDVVSDLYAQVGHKIDLPAENGPGKAVVGDAYGRHAARLGQPLEDRNAVAHLGKVVGARRGPRDRRR